MSPPFARPHREVHGTIAYTSRRPGQHGALRGHERFAFTHHRDGSSVLRAHCFIAEPDPCVMRDVTLGLGPDRRPTDCTVRLVVGDTFMGSGWFRFGADFIECESVGPSIGRVSQRVSLEAPLDGFGTHPIVADGHFLGQWDWTAQARRTFRMWLPSPDHRGATPPLLAPVTIDGVFQGRERIKVPAGSFDALHLQFLDSGASGMTGTHPPYDVWITDDADAVFLQGGVGGYMQTWYELRTLERADASTP